TASGHALSLLYERGLSAETSRPWAGQRWPFVGREREIAALSALLEECVAEPRARAVLVTGPAGVGKSRLRQAFLSSARQKEGAGAEVWIARGDPGRVGSSLGMAAQIVAQAAGIGADDPVGARLTKLGARLGRRLSPEDAH